MDRTPHELTVKMSTLALWFEKILTTYRNQGQKNQNANVHKREQSWHVRQQN